MKRYGNLWSTICSMDNLKLAHKNARKGKTWYKEVKMVDENPEYYLKEIQTMLVLHTFKTSEYVVFDKQEGNKIRTIYKLPYYPDRIVQWAILQVIEPYIIKSFISQTYSAIPGRGTHKALRTISNDITRDPDGCQWCYKFDIHHYYQSINHNLLLDD